MSVKSLPDLLCLRAEEAPTGDAVLVEGREPLTYGQWNQRARALAVRLALRGVRPGDRVGLQFSERDWPEFAVAYCGTQLAGAVAVPLSDRLAPAELDYMLGHCEAVAVLHSAGLRRPPGPWWTAALTEIEPDAADGTEPEITMRGDDPAQILYTSGTTGRPKGVVATHANLVHGAEIRARRRRFGHSQILLHAFPIGTNAAQLMLFNALDAHPAVLSPARFTPARFARLIGTRPVGTVFLVPSMAIELLDAGLHERYDFSGVRLLGSAAAALPPAVARRLAQAFPNAAIVNYYTSTEAAPAQTIMMYDPARPGALGRPAAGSALRILTEKGAPAATDEVGEVWLRSAAASRAYLGEGASPTFRDGWVRMGDLGRLDADGYLYLVDRESDVVKSGAFKVSTLHVESALHEHPDIAEAAVFGLPHPVLGTVLAAAVVPRRDATLSPTSIRAFLMDRIATHELPARVAVLESLPKNTSGKVLKRRLPELLDSSRS
ncbi:class I adenylate-forming enzyme family protein [Nonomuraea soli]|uniref:Acyl-CoA synthetase (AMP-forming)/AMP-acid ligase II n=1 Tax=Nonomuraea soli TaxID=1032476 RepID=A0A7W0HPA7_9ACTN|nr:class I adenylate-forming enzyme family protein [Nonomuraea soli]MBA2890557.1 acyl-CoA synthetase (AMP-forming)/AMP-acid ligase II [Nonomuraea soli]